MALVVGLLDKRPCGPCCCCLLPLLDLFMRLTPEKATTEGKTPSRVSPGGGGEESR